MKCEAFELELSDAAMEHIKDFTIVKEYGSSAYGHPLHTWDRGERYLIRCNKCGGFILVQSSEYHGFGDDDDYVDYFPVENEDEAEMLNKKYDGFAIETEFTGRYLMKTNGRVSWSREK